MTAFSQPERRGLERQQLAQPENHPDADLLTAFAEQALTVRERDQVLGHLAACPTCREVLSLAGSPLVEPVPEPARKRGIWEMPLFHWGTVAATAAVVVVAVSIGMLQPRRQAPRTAAVSEAPPPSQVTMEDKVTAEPGTQKALSKNDSSVPGALPAENVPPKRAVHLQQEVRYEAPDGDTAAKDKIEASAEAGVMAKKVAPPPPPPPPTVNGRERDYALNTRSNAELARNAADLKQAPAAAPPQASGGVVSGAAAPQTVRTNESRTIDLQSGVVTQNPENVPARAQKSVVGGALHKMQPMSADAYQVNAIPQPAAAQWQITKEGQLQRSAKPSGAWENVLAGQHVRSVAAVGNHVWVGADNGLLYSSSDNGVTWTPVALKTPGASATGDIVRLRFTDAQNGIVQTSTGETWLTADGGATWNKR